MQAPAASSGDAKSGSGKILLRSSGRDADPNAVGDALWMLLLSYLDASLPGQGLFLYYVEPLLPERSFQPLVKVSGVCHELQTSQHEHSVSSNDGCISSAQAVMPAPNDSLMSSKRAFGSGMLSIGLGIMVRSWLNLEPDVAG